MRRTGGSFLVAMDAENATLTLNDVNSTPHKYDIPDSLIYALISKDDYYGGAANYNIISDSVFDRQAI